MTGAGVSFNVQRSTFNVGGSTHTEASDTLVHVRDLVVRRGGRVVLEVRELGVRRGDLMAVIGPNGAGKSTLAAVLGLIERPERAELWFDGRVVDWRRDGLATRRRLAMVFQEPLLFDTSVFENVAAGLRLRGVSRDERRARVELWMERLRIAHLAWRAARTLSGGEAQRTSLARALVLEPELLLLDEPFAALDLPTREAVIMDLMPLLRAQQITTVLVTHDHDEALTLGDRVAVLLAGRIAQVDTPERILERPASPEVAAFLRPRRLALVGPPAPNPGGDLASAAWSSGHFSPRIGGRGADSAGPSR